MTGLLQHPPPRAVPLPFAWIFRRTFTTTRTIARRALRARCTRWPFYTIHFRCARAALACSTHIPRCPLNYFTCHDMDATFMTPPLPSATAVRLVLHYRVTPTPDAHCRTSFTTGTHCTVILVLHSAVVGRLLLPTIQRRLPRCFFGSPAHTGLHSKVCPTPPVRVPGYTHHPTAHSVTACRF